MPLRLIDPDKIHAINIADTAFKIRAMSWGSSLKYSLSLSHNDMDGMMEILIQHTINIEGFPDISTTISRMTLTDILKLGQEISKISSLAEEEIKN